MVIEQSKHDNARGQRVVEMLQVREVDDLGRAVDTISTHVNSQFLH
jgi:hypothetical protein